MLERREGLADGTKSHIQEIQGICLHVSGRLSVQSNQLEHLSHLYPCYQSRSKKNYNSIQCRLSGKISIFYVSTIQRIYLSSDDFYSDSTLILTTIAVK
jgi:hypothetical protein